MRFGQRLERGASQWRLESEFRKKNRTFGAGYGYRAGGTLDLDVQVRRREAVTDDAPGYEITLRARIRW